MIKYGNLDVNVIGNANKIYQGLTKGGYQWVDIDNPKSITVQEQDTCCGLRFSVDDYMDIGRPSWYFTEICEIDGQRKGGSFSIENDELVLILGIEMGDYCGEDEEGQPIYMELGRWHRGETVELESDTLTVRWEMGWDIMYTIPWQCYIDRKGTGRIAYQRLKAEEPTPTGDFKWKATYQGGSVLSAQCDSTSEIIQYEIPVYDADRNFVASVEVGDCVTELGESLFLSQGSLTALTIPDSVISVGNNAFYGCSRVTNIKISANLETIGDGAFSTIKFPNAITLGNVITISDYAFRNCVSLPSVKIGNKITSIGGRAFDSCTNLTSVIIEATTPPTLGRYVFRFTNDCPLLVPASALETYKSASGWSEYASRIQPIP